jgi:hypothetical protein
MLVASSYFEAPLIDRTHRISTIVIAIVIFRDTDTMGFWGKRREKAGAMVYNILVWLGETADDRHGIIFISTETGKGHDSCGLALGLYSLWAVWRRDWPDARI